MNSLDLLTLQTRNAYDWTNRLIDTIPLDRWDIIPDTIESTITWQVGHLIMSHYFHSVMVIVGHQMDILQKVPLREYDMLFTNGHPKDSVGKTAPSDLRKQLTLIQEKSLEIIQSLTLGQLEEPLVPTPTPHPIAKTKFEALDWNCSHAMYHCGQIGIIKRIVDQRHDFGLRKA